MVKALLSPISQKPSSTTDRSTNNNKACIQISVDFFLLCYTVLQDAIIRRYLLIYLLIYLIGLDLSANLSSYFRDVCILYNQYYVYNQYYMYVVTCMSTTIFLHWVHHCLFGCKPWKYGKFTFFHQQSPPTTIAQ